MSRQKIKARKMMKCKHCSKDKKKNLSYYRDGIYYCNKNCWKKWKKDGK